MNTMLGAIVVGLAGLLMGGGVWPFKLMRKYQFEHWWFVAMIVGLVIVPWSIVLLGCDHPGEALLRVPLSAVIIGNLFAVGWGIATMLCGLCYVHIGVALTGAILSGMGVSVGAILPLVFKGSGLFRNAPSLGSAAGLMVVLGVCVMLVGIGFGALAGFGRERQLRHTQKTSGNFTVWLLVSVVAGVLSSFMCFAFVYSQDSIVACFSPSDSGSIPATFAVYALVLLSGAVINIGYATYLLTRNRSWGVLFQSGHDFLLTLIIGVSLSMAVAFAGKGMLLLGTLGASVGWGIQQAMQMTGMQLLGFISGEWRGIHGAPRRQIYVAIALFFCAVFIMAYGNTFVR